MIVDSSVLVAILRDESDAEALTAKLLLSPKNRVSAANYVEAALVVDRDRDAILSRRLDDLIRETAIEIAPVTEAQAKIARDAHKAFGRGSGSPAKLNYGDCFAYALAIDLGEPLLFKGKGFTHTGIEAA